MKYYQLLICLIALISFSCKDRVPSKYPSEREMTQLLVELHMAEATLSQSTNKSIDGDKQILGSYKYVLDKHHLTKAEFDSALLWYAGHPVVYQRVYDEVIAVLSEEEAANTSLISKAKNESKINSEAPKPLNLWKGPVAYQSPLVGNIDKQLPFSYPVDSLENGEFQLRAIYKLKNGGKTLKREMMLIALFADKKTDTARIEIKKIPVGSAPTILKMMIPSGKMVTEIKGYLFKHDINQKSDIDVTDIHLDFYPGSASVKK